MKNKLKLLKGALHASHFGPTVLVTTISLLLSIYYGFHWKSLLVALSILTGQLIVGWTNDIHDFEDDLKHNRLSKPLVNGEITKKELFNLIFAFLPITLLISIFGPLGYVGGSIAFLGILVAISYNFYFKFNFLSPLPYVVCFGALPLAISIGVDKKISIYGILSGALFGLGAHFLNVLKDLFEDRSSGIKGLPQLVGSKNSKLVAFLSILIGFVMFILFISGGNNT